MTLINFIRKFPEINKKDEKYYLYLGMIAGLGARELLGILKFALNQDTIKRKIILNHIMYSAPKWTQNENNEIFTKVFSIKNSLQTYYKKESASMLLMALFPHISKINQNKISKDLSQSRYKNNRKRIYTYFYKNWNINCEKIIERAWTNFKDEDSLGIIVGKMPREFLLKNLDELLTYFIDENLSYDFFLKILRNNLYSRIYDDIPTKIQELKNKDPISYIFIMKTRKEKIEIEWAIKIYKIYSHTRYLARWYSEINLWEDILKVKPDFLSELTNP